MATQREPVGEIACLLCKRPAELHSFEERQKLDPDSAGGGGKPTYPKKFFVVCPPVTGYRGCGTILANGPGAQSRLMELGRVFGAGARANSEVPASDSAPPTPAAVAPAPPSPAKPAPAKSPFKLW